MWEHDYEEEYYELEDDYEAPREPESGPDLPEHVWHDDQALTNCWLAALHEYKIIHPAQFAPTARSTAIETRRAMAPLWYGPSTDDDTAMPPTAEIAIQVAQRVPDRPIETPATKKRKRKARAARQKPKDQTADPVWQPASPDLKRARFQEPNSAPDKSEAQSPLSPASSSMSTTQSDSEPPTLVHPNGAEPPPQPLPRLAPSARPRPHFPDPPEVADLDQSELPDLDDVDEQELLNAALWSWFTAGYNTALYNLSRQRV